jgi:hypothetical protein
MSTRLELLAAIGVAQVAGACAAAGKAAPEAAAAPERPVVYERILGSFTVDPDLAILLDPRVCARHCSDHAEPQELAAMGAAFSALGLARGRAVAELNSGALLWHAGDAAEAYRRVMEAREAFSRLGDTEGLAYCYEWLGYMFRESGEPRLAAEHLGLSYRLFELLGRASDLARVEGYGEEG